MHHPIAWIARRHALRSPPRRLDVLGRVRPVLLQRLLLGTVLLVGIGLLAWWLRSWLGQPAGPQRQVARIALLPDTPPPPPPPPKDPPEPPPWGRNDAKCWRW